MQCNQDFKTQSTNERTSWLETGRKKCGGSVSSVQPLSPRRANRLQLASQVSHNATESIMCTSVNGKQRSMCKTSALSTARGTDEERPVSYTHLTLPTIYSV